MVSPASQALTTAGITRERISNIKHIFIPVVAKHGAPINAPGASLFVISPVSKSINILDSYPSNPDKTLVEDMLCLIAVHLARPSGDRPPTFFPAEWRRREDASMIGEAVTNDTGTRLIAIAMSIAFGYSLDYRDRN